MRPLPAARAFRAILPFLGALALAGCDMASSGSTASVPLTECRLPKLALAVRCATIDVPENRDRADGRRIRIHVAVLAANTLSGKPDPLFILAGGPGQAASHLGPFAALLNEVRKDRDLVLIDQRGTGRSAPLECKAFRRSDALDVALELDPVPRARACVAELAAQGVDAAQYTTAAWVEDLDAVRAALGYGQVNLWGGSYGTRVALDYLRAHGAHVRAVVLDSVAPPSLRIALDVWATREAAIADVFAACARSAPCQRAHPDLIAELDSIADALGPAGRVVELVDPRTGEQQRLTFTMEHVIAGLQPLLYAPELAGLLPEVIGRAAKGDFGPLLASASLVTSELVEQVNSALYYSVTCGEDARRVDPADAARVLEGVRARTLAERGLAVCDFWPRRDPAAQPAAPVQSDVPVLLLSGGLDPVTPPAYGAEVAKTLAHSRHIVATGYGHVVSPHACAPRLIAAFVADPSFATLPDTCVQHLQGSIRPPLWPDRLGPRP